MEGHGFTGRMARTVASRPWWAIASWLALILVAAFFARSLGDVLTVEEGNVEVETESQRADDLLAERLGRAEPLREFVIVHSDTATVGDAAFNELVASLTAELNGVPGVVSVAGPLLGIPGLVSADGHTALLVAAMEPDPEDVVLQAQPLVELVEATDAANPGFRLGTVGTGSINGEFIDLAESTLVRAEVVGVPIAMLILMLVFGAVVAAGVPLVFAAVAIVVALGITALVGRVFDLNVFIENMITAMGLAVGIDYTLFILQRFREARAKGFDKLDAITVAGSTATRAVVFSGLTVIVALTGLMYMPIDVMRSLGFGAILAVAASMLAAMTLLPALLALVGDRVNWLPIPYFGRRRAGEATRFWDWVTSKVTRRPVVSVVAVTALLLAAASPYLTISLGSVTSMDQLPEESSALYAFNALNEEFSAGLVTTSVVVAAADVTDPAVAGALDDVAEALRNDDLYGDVTLQPGPNGDLAVIEAVFQADPASQEGRRSVLDLRQQVIPAAFAGVEAEALVTGSAAVIVDQVDVINSRSPAVIAFVLGLSFILLLLLFRSVVVPLKAVLMNLLSVGAAYGLLVLVFQHGVGADLFGFLQTDAIEFWLPIFLFTVLFGLSMDYHVFLLSRIKERWDQTGDNSGSVAFGLGVTGFIITGAALIMVAVFGGFAAGDLVMFQQMGFGLGVAVILDATLIRSVLVPAAMELLGDRNWYFPRWLEWLPEFHIEARDLPTTGPAATTPAEDEHAPVG